MSASEQCAAVAVDYPDLSVRTYSYAVPTELAVAIGDGVMVPFGRSMRRGVVFGLSDAPPPELDNARLKQVVATVSPSPLLNPRQLELAEWVAGYFRSPLYAACALMLPPTARSKLKTFVWRTAMADTPMVLGLNSQKKALLKVAPGDMSSSLAPMVLAHKAGVANGALAIGQLVRDGYLAQRHELASPVLKRRAIKAVKLAVDPDHALALAQNHKQTDLVHTLKASFEPLTRTALRKRCGVALDWALDKRIATLHEVEIGADPLSGLSLQTDLEPTLSREQNAALNAMRSAPDREHLLFGDTGTGKTEVYLHAIDHCLQTGRQALLLVPEIALTPQILGRVAARFPGRVGLLHSRLTAAQRLDQWLRIRSGELDVVIGPRSALFAPLDDIGLIAIDEEHESSYKQEHTPPLYDTRTVARRMAKLHRAQLVLGSATPALHTFRRVERGDATQLRLTQRPFATEKISANLSVELVDMRAERKAGNWQIFSRRLTDALRRTVATGNKAILMVNRRGLSIPICDNCHAPRRCPNCEVSLVLHQLTHSRTTVLLCHYCAKTSKLGSQCEACGASKLRPVGTGSQMVANAVGQTVPNVSVVRWDSDSATDYADHQRILSKFATAGPAVLVGTQMVAKGLDIPDVTLVAAVAADVTLNFPDYCSDERTFQLITQLIGRAGRGKAKGLALVQTNQPEHYAIRCAADWDYHSFYRKALKLRVKYGLPPSVRLIRLIYVHTSLEKAYRTTSLHATALRSLARSSGNTQVSVAGPTPCTPMRVNRRWMVQIILKGARPENLLDLHTLTAGWTVDVDPISLTSSGSANW